ncbi:MAG: hypothetical protein M1358_08480 [Chloroflexi bacterium]|nr:hypothetical protein [Chloroflexota bacterium]
MLNKLEEMDRQVWDAHPRMLEDVTHVLGGAGVGLLVYSAVARWARPIGYTLLGMSFFLHLYAFVAAQPKIPARPKIEVPEPKMRRAA